MYKHIARSYDNLRKEEQLVKLKIIKDNLKIIPPLLDVGCGTANFLISILQLKSFKEFILSAGNQLVNTR